MNVQLACHTPRLLTSLAIHALSRDSPLACPSRHPRGTGEPGRSLGTAGRERAEKGGRQMTMATPVRAAMPRTRSPSLGARLEGAGTRFRVWAPRARTIEVVVQRPGAAPHVATLEASPDGHFSGLIPSAKAGGRYRYRIDGMGPFPRFRCRASGGLARFGPTTPRRVRGFPSALCS